MVDIFAEINGESHVISGDFSQASSPLWIDGKSTPFQVADARHREDIAVALCLSFVGAANLPDCPIGMTPREWRKRLAEFPDWGNVSFREATDEEVAEAEAEAD